MTEYARGVETTILRGGSLTVVLRNNILASIRRLRDLGGTGPELVTLAAGEDSAAAAYRSSIERTMAKVGIGHHHVQLAPDATNEQLLTALEQLSGDPAVTGVLVLMPLPEQLSVQVVNEYLSPMKDIDGITPANAGRLHLGLPCLAPSTPLGGMVLLDHYGVEVSGKRACVVGRSNVVGRPMSALLLQRDATVMICHSKTRDLSSLTRSADIVTTAVGKPGWLNREFISAGTTVLDFGINVVDGTITGDADFSDLVGVAGSLTPVPGGTGPITTLMLARNTVEAGHAQLAGNLDSLKGPLEGISQFRENDPTAEPGEFDGR